MLYTDGSKVQKGDTVMADAGFTCLEPGTTETIQEKDGELYIPCSAGRHYLDGQLGEDGVLVGLVKVR